MSFFNSGSTMKSAGEANCLNTEVLQAQDFNPSDLVGFNTLQENKRLDDAINDPLSSLFLCQFSSCTVKIEVPSGKKNVEPTKFRVPDLL
ncbi:hypothetical protein DXG01_012152 [Tephrocybe rancida]|nr:hypothetical protein DXG01_012152 [Tephrocybe rancida]